MKIKTFGIGCGSILFLLLLFGIYRVAFPWETMRFGGYEVQRNRITERVRLRVGDVWEDSLNDAPYADPLSEADLARVKLSDPAFGTHGYFCGKATITGDKPLNGRLALVFTIRNRNNGKLRTIESERALRCNVAWAVGGPHPFVLNTAMTAPAPAEKYTVEIVPVSAVNQ